LLSTKQVSYRDCRPSFKITSEETLKAKLCFESLTASLGVSIKHYHADNCRFADNAFMKDVEKKGQT
jgi:hypothetical protein